MMPVGMWWVAILACSTAFFITACSSDDADGDVVPASIEEGSELTLSKTLQSQLPGNYGAVHSGEATYYSATGEGNCSFDATDNLMVAAINTEDYASAKMCGAFVRVKGPEGVATVRIVDRCPGCGDGGIDLSREAFTKIASPDKGRVPVTWQVVAGPVEGNVAYYYMDGTTRYWMAVQVRNHRWPVDKFEIMPQGSSEWIPVERRSYNFFVMPKPISSGPLRVRVTSVTGTSLEDEIPEPAGKLLVQGSEQF